MNGDVVVPCGVLLSVNYSALTPPSVWNIGTQVSSDSSQMGDVDGNLIVDANLP